METAMLVLTIISTLVAIASFVVSYLVKKDTKQIRIEREEHNVTVDKNDGVVADSIRGDITLNGKEND